MKILKKAIHLYDEILNIKEEIKTLDSIINFAIDSNYAIKFKIPSIDEYKNKNTKNKDDNEFSMESFRNTKIIDPDYFDNINNIKFIVQDKEYYVDKIKKHEFDLTTTETIIMFSALLNFKKDTLKSMIKDFSKLETKIIL